MSLASLCRLLEEGLAGERREGEGRERRERCRGFTAHREGRRKKGGIERCRGREWWEGW